MATAITREDIAEIWDGIADRIEATGGNVEDQKAAWDKMEAARYNAATIREVQSGLTSKGLYDFR